jgi:hypothetical protein
LCQRKKHFAPVRYARRRDRVGRCLAQRRRQIAAGWRAKQRMDAGHVDRIDHASERGRVERAGGVADERIESCRL